MKKDKCKPEMYNSYKCDESVVRVNDFSTISADLVSQMVSVDFPVHYNCIIVHFYSSVDFLEQLVEVFFCFAEKYFTVVLIQRVGVKEAVFNVFSPRDMYYIHSRLYEFECAYLSHSHFRMQY